MDSVFTGIQYCAVGQQVEIILKIFLILFGSNVQILCREKGYV